MRGQQSSPALIHLPRRKHRGDTRRCAEAGQGRGRRGRRRPLLRPARPHAALLDPGARADRGRLRGGSRLRRLVDPRLPGDPGVGHAPDARPEHRGHRPVPRAQDDQHQRVREGPGHRRELQPRPALHREEGRGLPQGHRPRRHRVLRSRSRVLHLRLGALRPEPVLGLLLPRLGRGRLELRSRLRARRQPQPRLQAAVQGGLLPGPADGLVPGPPLRDGAGARAGRHLDRGAAPRGRHRRPGRDRHALRRARR